MAGSMIGRPSAVRREWNISEFNELGARKPINPHRFQKLAVRNEANDGISIVLRLLNVLGRDSLCLFAVSSLGAMPTILHPSIDG